jgi:hypothetical protein
MNRSLLTKLVFLLLFSIGMIPYITNCTDTVTQAIIITPSDANRLDPQDITYNEYYGPLNTFFIKHLKSFAFHLAHTDKQYLIIMFSLFIFVPLFIGFFLTLFLYDILSPSFNKAPPSFKKIFIDYFLLLFLFLLFSYFFVRRHFFSNEILTSPLTLFILFFFIKDRFHLKKYFYLSFIPLFFIFSLNTLSIPFVGFAFALYFFYSLSFHWHNKLFLKKTFLLLFFTLLLFSTLLISYFLFGFDFRLFLYNSSNTLHFRSYRIIYIFSYVLLSVLFAALFIKALKNFSAHKKDIVFYIFFISLTITFFYIIFHFFFLYTSWIFVKRTPIILAFLTVLWIRFLHYPIKIFIFLYIFYFFCFHHLALTSLYLLRGAVPHQVEKKINTLLNLEPYLIDNLKKIKFDQQSIIKPYLNNFLTPRVSRFSSDYTVLYDRFIMSNRKIISRLSFYKESHIVYSYHIALPGIIFITEIHKGALQMKSYYDFTGSMIYPNNLIAVKFPIEQSRYNKLGYQIDILK